MDWEEENYGFEGDLTGWENPEEGEEYKADFKQLQHASQIKEERQPRFMKTQRERALEQIHGILSSKELSTVPEGQRNKVVARLEQMPVLENYHLPTLILAALWEVQGHALNKKNFQDFAKSFSEVLATPVGKKEVEKSVELRQADLLRYIRMLGRAA